MKDLEKYAATVVCIAGGEKTGKTRLQKTAYLLEAMNLGFDLDFDYHKFGPFSAEFAFALDDAETLGYLETDEETGYGPVTYTIYKATDKAWKFELNEKHEERESAVNAMNKHSVSVLLLAASAVYLKRNGCKHDVWQEIKVRKSLMASENRLRDAKNLVNSLQLEI